MIIEPFGILAFDDSTALAFFKARNITVSFMPSTSGRFSSISAGHTIGSNPWERIISIRLGEAEASTKFFSFIIYTPSKTQRYYRIFLEKWKY